MCPKRNPNNTSTQRQCTECGEVKPLDDFPIDKWQTYGRKFRCRPCHSAQNSKYMRRVTRDEPEKARQWRKANYERNKDRILQRTSEYARAHPEQDRAKQRRQRAQRSGAAVVDLTREQWETQRVYFGYRCAYCHDPLTRDDQDHIVPTSKGGNHTLENVVPVCPTCNSGKRDRSLIECLLKGIL